jgi:Ni,Fe-hydrogenase III small subunit
MLSQGTCNGCELELLSCFCPRFDVERYGIVRVPSPRHADVVLVTGCGTKKAAEKAHRILEQVPEPKAVVLVGACALNGGVFKCRGPRLEGDVRVQGCPPRPSDIIKAIKEAAEKCSSKS